MRWQVIRIEMSEGMGGLALEPGYDAAHVTFFWTGLPLGHKCWTASELPFTQSQLASQAARLTAPALGDRILREGFHRPLPGVAALAPLCNSEGALNDVINVQAPLHSLGNAEPADPDLSVSLVVCTKNRPSDLARCLRSLGTLEPSASEIIVVDNDPGSGLTKLVVDGFPGIRYVPEPRLGLSAARNRGLSESASQVVLFVDDDVVIHTQLIRRLRSAFRDERTMVVTGLVLPAELETDAQILFENHLGYFHQGYHVRKFDSRYFDQMRNEGVPTWSIGAGANMGVRRRAFEMNYAFDERFGPGVFGGCGEDSEYWYRLLADGWSIVYDPAVVVYHHHRRDIGQLRKLVRDYMKGHVAALIAQYRRYGHIGNLRRLAITLPVYYFLVFGSMVIKGFQREERIVMAGLPGAIAGLRFAFTGSAKRRQSALRPVAASLD